MPHTTISETPSPTCLGNLSTLEVWDDPRRMTTFSTFHQLNGSNNGSFAETSFQNQSSNDKNHFRQETNGNTTEEKRNGINEKQGNGQISSNNDVKHADIYQRNNFRVSPSKLSPKLGKYVKPIISVPPVLDFRTKNLSLNGNGIQNGSINGKQLSIFTNQDNHVDSKNILEPKCNPEANRIEKNGGLNENDNKQESDLTNGNDIVDINLGANDKRFGFSVVGGCDEGFNPRIENITSGSPADRADLEVGDEILEVNGRSLDNCTHTEVISHIHQCIRSRTICLRVKRKTSCKLALDLAKNSNVQDAFVIAVEQQARERLEKLSALKKIKPVDMTKLSQELNECANSASELNGVIENNPIYVTTVPEIHNATLERVKKDRLDSYANTTASSSRKDHHGLPIQGMNGHSHMGIDQESHDQELELKQEILDKEGYDETLSPSSPETPPRERLLIESQNGMDRITARFSQECVSVETLLPNLPDKQIRSSPNDSHPSQHLSNTGKSEKQLPIDFSKTNCIATNKSIPFKVSNVPEHGLRTHREMAVDVPDSFVGVAKTTPRYPPQKSEDNASGYQKESHPEFFINSSGDSSSNENDLKLNSLIHKNTLNRYTSDAPKSVTDSCDYDRGSESYTEEQIERIRKYQEEIRRRKLVEEKIARENEFLRTSLRGSKKLQALESNPPQHGMENTAFELEDDDSGSVPIGRQHSGRLVGKMDEIKTTPELAKTYGASELLQSLYRLSASLQGNGHKDSDLMLVEGLIRNPDFQNILAIHNKVQEVCCFKCPPTPLTVEAQDITQEVINTLQESSTLEAVELVDILSKYEFEGLMYAHDKIAERQAVPTITPDEELLDRASQYTEESVKIVRIDKTNEPLGATVRNEGEAVVIGRIVKGGAAEKSGLLHEGDEILEVNGVEMRGKSVNDVCDILATMNGTLTFLIIPTQQEMKKNSHDVVMHVKAHFDYDPDDDLYIPCRELGISFQKGDILHVISQEDPNWWQAYREGEEDQALAGLVPSKNFQQQRESMKQTIIGETNSKEKSKKGKFLCAKKYHRKKKKKLYNPNLSEDSESDQILTYEEVALYYPRANRKRPTVLIGPPNIGRHELRQRLMEDTERFAAAVPHTSRTKRDGEMDGADYHFISRSQFEADIASGKFVEHGEYEKNYYGTSLDAIRAVVNSGKICVLNLHPQSLKILKNSDLKPYVVFVAPPSLEKLRQNRLKAGDNPKDDELKDIIEKAREMEENFGHYFDMVIINSDIDKAFNELLKEINTLEREPQWVPRIWLKNYSD